MGAKRLNEMPGDKAITWSQRYKANLEKLGSGDSASVPEVIGDLEVRDRERGLNAGEKRMLAKVQHRGSS
jgi:CarD family transcriptional regulator, regulator of rRNA transcription